MALQTNKIKHGQVAALETQNYSIFLFKINYCLQQISLSYSQFLHHPSLMLFYSYVSFVVSFYADLQWRDLQGVLHQGGCIENNRLRDERRLDGPRVKEVGVVAHFAELHEDVNDRHEVTAGQRLSGPVNQRQKLINEEAKMATWTNITNNYISLIFRRLVKNLLLQPQFLANKPKTHSTEVSTFSKKETFNIKCDLSVSTISTVSWLTRPVPWSHRREIAVSWRADSAPHARISWASASPRQPWSSWAGRASAPCGASWPGPRCTPDCPRSFLSAGWRTTLWTRDGTGRRGAWGSASETTAPSGCSAEAFLSAAVAGGWNQERTEQTFS